MHETPTPAQLLAQLKGMDTFRDIADEALYWLIDRSKFKRYKKGEYLFKPGQATEYMQIVLEGAYEIMLPQVDGMREVGIFEAPHITGLLPFSRMAETKAFGTAIADATALELHKSFFVEMVTVSYEMTQALVAAMSNRIRSFTEIRLQDEKLMSLGKLSAGLAHELNNPASAIVRSVEELYNQVHYSPEWFKAVVTMKVTPEETDQVNAMLSEKIHAPTEFDNLSLLQQEERKDALLDWLDDRGIGSSEDMAEVFAAFDLTEEDLDKVAAILEPSALEPVLTWVRHVLNMEKIVAEVKDAAVRIADLVSSVKSYSYMDQAQNRQAVDIHEGIRSTLAMLKHKVLKKQIQIDKLFDLELPAVEIYPGEMNQVWTNIIDNALDALPAKGVLELKTYAKHGRLFVDITDNGPGIPESVLPKIFDPFFTTKPVGQGTGLGLEVSRRIVKDRHKGSLDVASVPGRTTFTVCLPLGAGQK